MTISDDELAEMAIDTLWRMLNDERLKGCSPYEAARKIGLGAEPAKIVERRWDGPKVFPGG
jgi:hypothetical protein